MAFAKRLPTILKRHDVEVDTLLSADETRCVHTLEYVAAAMYGPSDDQNRSLIIKIPKIGFSTSTLKEQSGPLTLVCFQKERIDVINRLLADVELEGFHDGEHAYQNIICAELTEQGWTRRLIPTEQ